MAHKNSINNPAAIVDPGGIPHFLETALAALEGLEASQMPLLKKREGLAKAITAADTLHNHFRALDAQESSRLSLSSVFDQAAWYRKVTMDLDTYARPSGVHLSASIQKLSTHTAEAKKHLVELLNAILDEKTLMRHLAFHSGMLLDTLALVDISLAQVIYGKSGKIPSAPRAKLTEVAHSLKA